MESLGEAEPRSTGDTALFKLAQIYTEGCGILKPNAKKAIEYLKNAFHEWVLADSTVHSYLVASYNLAEFYRDGKAGIKPDGYKVIEYLSELGHLETIAEIYRDGKYNVRANGYKAIKYFLEKSKRELITLDELAELYLQNGSDEKMYFFEARDICNVDVFEEIAQIYLEGKGGVRPDGYKALKYLSQAVNGINRIINFTKKFIENNSEIKQERPEMLRRVFHRLSRANREISEQIAEIYSDGKAGVQPDGHKAIKYFLKAVETERDNPDEDSKENVSAIYNKIAWIYLEGCGNVQTDGYKAIEYFEKCSNFERIAEIYRYGKFCVESDPQKAIEYFLKHEATIRRPQNSDNIINDLTIFFDNEERASAFSNIAEIYFSLNDGQKALEYFLKADELGDSWAWASDEVSKIYRYGKGNLKPDGVKLIKYLTKKLEQIESPDNSILYDIAKAYEEGCGSLEPNMQKALEFYKKAAALGNNSAKEELAIRRLL